MVRVLRVDPRHPAPEVLAQAGEVLRRGGLVAFPTETVYGLGADAFNPQAVARIFQVKGRPASDPVIVHIASHAQLHRVAAEVPAWAEPLIERWMPGPLTLVLPKRPEVPDVVTAGKPTVAVRMPAHPVALGLIRAAGTPVAAPSANRFGHTSPTRAEHVLADLGEAVDVVLDAGPTPIGVESTILDATRFPPRLLRPGGAPKEALEALLGVAIPVVAAAVREEEVMAPGMLPRHYAPQGSALWLFVGPVQPARAWMQATARDLHRAGRRVGLLAFDEDLAVLGDALPAEVAVVRLGPEADPEAVARRLFAALREMEAQGVEVILAREPQSPGLGLAVRDRLRRAADRIFS